MDYVLHYDYAAVFITVIILVHYLTKRSIKSVGTSVFRVILWMTLFSSVLDVATVICLDEKGGQLAGNLFNMAYLASFVSVPFFFFVYVSTCVSSYSKIPVLYRWLLTIPYIVLEVMIVSSPFTNWIFEYSSDDVYKRGALHIVMYAICGVYTLMAMVMLIVNQKYFSSGQVFAVAFFSIGAMCAIVAQGYLDNILFIQFAAALSTMLLYLAMENPETYENPEVGVFNRHALTRFILNELRHNNEFDVLILDIEGYKSIRDRFGIGNAHMILKGLCDEISLQYKKNKIFYLTEGQFAIYLHKDYKYDELVEYYDKAFNSHVDYMETSIPMVTRILRVSSPGDIKTVEDLLNIIEFASDVLDRKENNKIKSTNTEVLVQVKKENYIQNAVTNALRDENFEIYYQPIYSVKEKQYVTAEALLRLHDANYGFISPGEFIPVSERTGSITGIGEFVFRKVCETISKDRLWEKGIRYIEVNLSAVQCMQEHLYERVLSAMDKYRVPHCMINLEVTETSTILSEELLLNNMNALVESGVEFSLDDYGTGFANISKIINYPFKLIKTDKSMLWHAMEDERAMVALRCTISMLKALDLEIVVEGVETKEQVDVCVSLGCDYLQGYYFSRPLPRVKFIELLVNQVTDPAEG